MGTPLTPPIQRAAVTTGCLEESWKLHPKFCYPASILEPEPVLCIEDLRLRDVRLINVGAANGAAHRQLQVYQSSKLCHTAACNSSVGTAVQHGPHIVCMRHCFSPRQVPRGTKPAVCSHTMKAPCGPRCRRATEQLPGVYSRGGALLDKDAAH